MIDKKVFIYNKLSEKIGYSEQMKKCIETTVENLIKVNTTSNKPGMLLGKIQSGKTRAFIGTMGLAFDNGYDVAIVLTKGTRALAEQTFQRLNKDFSEMIENDIVQVFDIMHVADNLRPYELNQKIIFVVKKQVHNLNRLYSALFEKYQCLADKKILVVDDEADYASVGFTKTKQEGLEINKIAGLIDTLRNDLKDCSFLQVTATPYSLYLQPEDMKLGGASEYFRPVRPAFTVLVPTGEGYIGGDYYFDESQIDEDIASYIHESVKEEELTALKKEDRRRFRIEESLTSTKIKSLRDAVINFIVGGCIRRIQEQKNSKYPLKYSFIIHIEQATRCHEWQERVVNKVIEMLSKEAENNSTIFSQLVFESYDNLIKSLTLIKDIFIPDFTVIRDEVRNALVNGYIMITKVNSENDINGLLDDKGQLKLRTPLNIFIGGQILDRGITIGNLIGFYYGRNPSSFQQDTVLQHSRMFGYRPMADLAVTKFYTTFRI
ncbi:Z1 domain-containing protein [Clostridium sp. UBA1353]|uniref:Z1 domain-containing protein n=1 Tax=Clostridium sp. UBA1353 TaxID=1946347 RepID=UPI0032162E66